MSARGFVLYDGPSRIDGARIVAIATLKSANRKTGPMVQTWILRADRAPLAALADGADASVCGDCVHRPRRNGARFKGDCYVEVGRAPSAVWKAWRRGRYALALDSESRIAVGAGRAVRIGSYGDPGAVPTDVWRALIMRAERHTGYTHRWHDVAPDLASVCMASVDSESERTVAWRLGWRTFRVADPSEADRARGEARCPASAEAGAKVQCIACPLACNGRAPGARAESIVIQLH